MKQNIDGFIVPPTTPNQRARKSGLDKPALPHKFVRPQVANITTTGSSGVGLTKTPQRSSIGLKRSDIDDSLRAVDKKPDTKKVKRFRRRRFRLRWVGIGLVLVLIAGGGYFAWKIMSATGRIVQGNVLDLLISNVELKADANGQTNILIFGTSEDDPGHSGAALTDSIIVLSLNQKNKTAAMVSMPRDMWVDYGRACFSGYAGKINALYSCGTDNKDDVSSGAALLQSAVGKVFGLDVQYYVKVNYTALSQAVDAVGGVTVMIESDDPRGIYDYNTNVKLPNGPATLNGNQALALARARGDGGGYGFEGSNFVREQYQQKILVALRDKALSTGALTNPVTVNNMIDALGDNVRTNFTTAEVKTLSMLAKDTPATSITRINLVDADKPVVTTGMYNGQSIVKPVAGIGNFSDIQALIRKHIGGGDLITEDATIAVLNASMQAGIATKKANELTAAGLLNVTAGDTNYSATTPLIWYDRSSGKKPKTLEKLTSVLGKAPAGTMLPTGVQSDADFVILLGDGTN